jgi:molybdate transport system substrate-binding protein
MKLRPVVAIAAVFLLQGLPVHAAEIKVLSAGGIRSPLEALIPEFERSSGHKVAIKFMGGPAVKTEIDKGEPFDVALSTSSVMDELVKAGTLVAASRNEIARAGVGIAVRAGAPKPDIGSVDAFKRALLNAKSIAYAGDGTAGMHFQGVLDRLGISKDIAPKARKTLAADPKNSAMDLVARGDAELGVSTVATIFRPGVEFVGPLPAELQTYIHFAAALGSGAKEPQAGAAFMRFVTSPPAAAAYKAKGMEPVPQR